MIEQLLLMVFPVAMAFAAANDLFTMRIPNEISLVLIAGFFAVAIWIGMPVETVGLHVGIGFAMLVATFMLFSFKMFGGGDAKLMAAGALWMGPEQISALHRLRDGSGRRSFCSYSFLSQAYSSGRDGAPRLGDETA